MPKHEFTETADGTLRGGWSDDGKVVCTWFWDSEAKTLRVRHAHITRNVSLNFAPEVMSEATLRERLPDIALRTANDIRAELDGK